MKKYTGFLFCLVAIAACKPGKQPSTPAQQAKAPETEVIDKGNISYDEYFTDRTMRLDYFHSGTATEDQFAAEGAVSDGAWPGSRTQLLDKLNLGPYFVQVIDKDSKLLLYSRGFGSIFGEWQTTPEAKKVWGTFHESLRFPWPKKPVTVVVQKRDTLNKFQTIWTTDIDPASRFVNTTEIKPVHKTDIIQENGPPSEKVDIVVLGDGYTMQEMEKFRADAKRLCGVLMGHEPFKSRSSDFNIRAIETPSQESGVWKPHPGVMRRTPLSVHYGAFDSERYALSYENKTIRDIASEVPYDFMVILMNERTYGGGGIYNLYTTVSAGNKFADYIMVHEFGHHLAALADEYYTSAVAYEVPEIKVEPWEPNITALFDKNNLKWKDLVEPGTPLPTPWNKEAFDKEGYKIQKTRDSLRAAKVPENVMEDLFIKQMQTEDSFFTNEANRHKVGAFEGAGYCAKGLYRSQVDCIMYTRHINFCRVCQQAIGRVMDQYSK